VALLETQVQYVMSMLKAAIDTADGRFEIEVRQDVHDATTPCVQEAWWPHDLDPSRHVELVPQCAGP
jgi:hypothetical protein